MDINICITSSGAKLFLAQNQKKQTSDYEETFYTAHYIVCIKEKFTSTKSKIVF